MTPPVSPEVAREQIGRIVDELLALYDDGRYKTVSATDELDGVELRVTVATCSNACGHPFHVYVHSIRQVGNMEIVNGIEWDVDARREVRSDS